MTLTEKKPTHRLNIFAVFDKLTKKSEAIAVFVS
jgi:hypothetical protein